VPPSTPDTPVQFLKGIGEGRARLFADAGIETVRDLIFFFPFRYEDRRHPARVFDLGRLIDTPVLLRGRVVSAVARVSPRKRMQLFEAVLDDGSGSVKLIWFNQRFLADSIKRGDRLAVYGIPRLTSYGAALTIESPDWEKFEGAEEEEGSIVPIYSKIGNVPPKMLRRLIGQALEALPAIEDPLPEEIRTELGVIDLHTAIRAIHQPAELNDDFLRQRSPAHLRVILQEFFTLQLALRVRRANDEVQTKTRAITIDDELREEVKRILPFRLTDAQKRVLREIADDLRSSKPMYRLLQGDVGSGKTIVALIAAILMIRNGHQAALLAPTEILVEQHFQRLSQLLDERVASGGRRAGEKVDNAAGSSSPPAARHPLPASPIVVARATGSMSAGERRTLLAGLRDGYIQLAVGTHALLEDRVKFKSLGLAIVDEQHRFGVEQRQKLFAKGEMPDILVMTATPIPRSLALAIYGDLELSVIDELPPGRLRIKTAVRAAHEVDRVYDFIDEEISSGAQIYIVYPIIEESEKTNLKPLTSGFESTVRRFPKRRVAMMHGRMKSHEKEETMQRFKRGEIDILVATTVIEVGIDVPNASIMLIVDADRFGLSQLHQLRGRVGRGTRKSYCILLHEERVAAEAKDRLRMFEKSKDGFEVAEHDLQIRGPGEFLGTRQSGALRFRMGNILRDYDLMEKARDLAIATIDESLPRAEEIAHRLLGVPVPAAAAKD
jgi:ATP-dependent DNA helicase RecG